MQEAFDNSIEIIKHFLLDVTKAILQKSGEVYLKNTRLSQILQPVFQIIEAEELKNKEESQVFEENFEEKGKKLNENNKLDEENSNNKIIKSQLGHEEDAAAEEFEENADYPSEEEEEEV